MTQATSRTKVAVVLASAGRGALLGQVIDDVLRQSRPAHEVVLSVRDEDSLPPTGVPEGVRVVYDRGGLASQRNAGLRAIEDCDLVFFFDDDAVLREDYLNRAVQFFDKVPDAIGLTGRVLLDGAAGEEIPLDVARATLEQSKAEGFVGTWHRGRELYGCNFGYRLAAAEGERFDARLPMYSWLEDHDIARRLLRRGLLARVDDCVIVHLGAKSGGRTAHVRLGYSQVMNPSYFVRKGSFPLWLALREILPRVAKNVVLGVVGSESEWRRKRVWGNLLAFGDILRGRFTPERITAL